MLWMPQPQIHVQLCYSIMVTTMAAPEFQVSYCELIITAIQSLSHCILVLFINYCSPLFFCNLISLFGFMLDLHCLFMCLYKLLHLLCARENPLLGATELLLDCPRTQPSQLFSLTVRKAYHFFFLQAKKSWDGWVRGYCQTASHYC